MFHGKIYKITNNIDSDIYVGSTINPLEIRFANHVICYQVIRLKHRLLYKKMNELGIENFNIELLDEIQCENKKDLYTLEGKYILQYGTLNKNIAGRNSKEYKRVYYFKNKDKYQQHYETNKDKFQQYYETHKDEILKKKQQYYETRRDEISKKRKQQYKNRKEESSK